MSRQDDANDVRIQALAALEEARGKLHSWQFLLALKSAEQGDRDKAAKAMLDVALARQTLSAAILGAIVDELEQEKESLQDAISDMERAVKTLDKVVPVLEAITSLIGVVGKIVKLV